MMEKTNKKKIQQQRREMFSIVHVETRFLFFSSQELWDQIKSSSSEDNKLQGMVESLGRMLHDSERKYQVREFLFLFNMLFEVWTVHVWWWLLKTDARHKENSAINRTDRHRSRFRVFILARQEIQTNLKDLVFWGFITVLTRSGQQKCKTAQRDKHLYSGGHCKRSLRR